MSAMTPYCCACKSRHYGADCPRWVSDYRQPNPMTDETPSQGLLVLERIASGHPDVLLAMQECFPSPYEIDMCDEDALRRLLEAIVAAARAPIASIPEPDMRGDVVERVEACALWLVRWRPDDKQLQLIAMDLRDQVAAIDAACPRHE